VPGPGWLQANVIADAVTEAIEPHLVERLDHERLAGELLDSRGQVGDLLLKVGDALSGGGHQAPASISGSASACRRASQAACSASAARYRSIGLAEGSAMTAAVFLVARA
jgi:hypothetical protein